MKTRPSLAVAVALAFCLVFGLLFSAPSAGQPPAAGGSAGRYQVVLNPNREYTTVFVIDTQTGQCWYRDTHPQVKEWTDLGSPVQKAAK